MNEYAQVCVYKLTCMCDMSEEYLGNRSSWYLSYTHALTHSLTDYHQIICTCTSLQTKLLLYDARFSPLEKIIQKHETALINRNSSANGVTISANSSNSSTQQRQGILNRTPTASSSSSTSSTSSFMWGIWQSGDEITLLLEESDIHQFPLGALQVSPQHWRVIKLSGRTVGFDETGRYSSIVGW